MSKGTMRSETPQTIVAIILATTSAAYAGDKLQLDVHFDTNGDPTNKCERKDVGDTTGTTDELAVNAVGGTPKVDVQISVNKAKATLAAGTTTAAFKPGIYQKEDFVVTVAGAGICTAKAVADGGKTIEPPVSFSTGRSIFSDTALTRLHNDSVRQHPSSRSVHGRTYKLIHLPDGTPAFPLPSNISEEDSVEFWIVLPEGASARVDVLACDKAPGFRVDGSYKDALAGVGKLETGAPVPDPDDPAKYALRSIGSRVQCAGTLTYKIETKGAGYSAGLAGTTTTSIAVDPIYRFEWGIGYMFDFARPHKLSLGDRPDATGMATEKFVIESDDYRGAQPIITLSVNVCGTNPRKLDLCDRLINPSIWLDPQRLKDGFGVGLGLRPFYGLSVVAGMTVFRSMQIADGTSVSPGDAWTATGDLPTKEVFDKNSLGFAIAATVSTEVFSQLFP